MLQFHKCILIFKPIVFYKILRHVAYLIRSQPLGIKTFTPGLLAAAAGLEHMRDTFPLRIDIGTFLENMCF